jgi:hypothetical protein
MLVPNRLPSSLVYVICSIDKVQLLEYDNTMKYSIPELVDVAIKYPHDHPQSQIAHYLAQMEFNTKPKSQTIALTGKLAEFGQTIKVPVNIGTPNHPDFHGWPKMGLAVFFTDVREIWLENMATELRAMSLAHEMGHALDPNIDKQSYAAAEIIAESTYWLVWRNLGYSYNLDVLSAMYINHYAASNSIGQKLIELGQRDELLEALITTLQNSIIRNATTLLDYIG